MFDSYNTMTSCFSNTAAVYVIFSLCSWRGYARNDRDSRVLLTNDGPTTIGGETTLSAVVVNCPGTEYWCCWESSKGNNCSLHKKPEISLVIDNWPSTGRKEYTLVVERTKPDYKKCGKNTTYIDVTDTINAKMSLSVQPHHNDYFVGAINISVQVHDPSHLFDPDDITYTWDFDDGRQPVINHLNKMTYTFTEDRVYDISVLITAPALGTLYNGTVGKTLHFKANLSPVLQIYNAHDHTPLPMLRLAPPTKDRVYVALGQVELIVAYNDPYSLVKSVTTGWSFQNGPTFPHLHGNNISYAYTKVGDTMVWVTPRFETPYKNETYTPLSKSITIQEPVTELNLTRNSSLTAKGELQVNVTCQGSKPFQMCWKLFKKSHSPLHDNCSSLSQDCDFHINYTIPYSGSYTLDVFVLNYVSSANYIQHFTLQEPTAKPHHDTAEKAVSALVPIVICVIIIVIILLFVAKKVYSSRHHSVLETADFDFRDEDSRSLDSYLVDNKCCHSFRCCRRFSRRKENIRLLEDWGSSRESTKTFYSVIL